MSLLHLLSVDNNLSFDGKGLDKAVDTIKGYANNKFIKLLTTRMNGFIICL